MPETHFALSASNQLIISQCVYHKNHFKYTVFKKIVLITNLSWTFPFCGSRNSFVLV